MKTIVHVFNLTYYTPKLWEVVVLWFCPLKKHESDTSVVWYKTFSNRMYIHGYFRSYFVNSEHLTTGFNQTLPNDGNTTQGYDNAENN